MSSPVSGWSPAEFMKETDQIPRRIHESVETPVTFVHVVGCRFVSSKPDDRELGFDHAADAISAPYTSHTSTKRKSVVTYPGWTSLTRICVLTSSFINAEVKPFTANFDEL